MAQHTGLQREEKLFRLFFFLWDWKVSVIYDVVLLFWKCCRKSCYILEYKMQLAKQCEEKISKLCVNSLMEVGGNFARNGSFHICEGKRQCQQKWQINFKKKQGKTQLAWK